jgi:hypothetical protein|nr:MAG TPA: ATP-dependent DNA helicase [Caudoviricetes sp.]
MKYSIGDMVYNKDYGVGRVSQIDEKSRDFTYLVKFKGHAMAWLSEKKLMVAEKPVETDASPVLASAT